MNLIHLITFLKLIYILSLLFQISGMNVEKSNASNKLSLIPKEISVGLKHYYVIVDMKGLGLAAMAVYVGYEQVVVLIKENRD